MTEKLLKIVVKPGCMIYHQGKKYDSGKEFILPEAKAFYHATNIDVLGEVPTSTQASEKTVSTEIIDSKEAAEVAETSEAAEVVETSKATEVVETSEVTEVEETSKATEVAETTEDV